LGTGFAFSLSAVADAFLAGSDLVGCLRAGFGSASAWAGGGGGGVGSVGGGVGSTAAVGVEAD
jgi:hypothetical protein